ncbi:MAG: mechanosensitive ion channel domain-containing protein [Acidiferrobacterales bacterium]
MKLRIQRIVMRVAEVCKNQLPWQVVGHFLFAAFFGALLCHSSMALAQPGPAGDDLAAMNQQLDRIERSLGSGAPDLDQLRSSAKDVSRIKSQTDRCASDAQQNSSEIERDLASLGKLRPGEPVDVMRQREALRQRNLAQQGRLGTCRLLSLRADQLLHRITDRQSELSAERLLVQGPTFAGLLRDNWTQPGNWVLSSSTFLQQHSGIELLSPPGWLALGAAAVVAILIGIVLRRRTLKWAKQRSWDSSFSGHFGKSIAITFAHFSLEFVLSITVALFFNFALGNSAQLPFVSFVAYGLPVYFLAVAAIRLFLAPFPPAETFVALPTEIARRLGARLRILVLLGYLGYVGFGLLEAQSLPQSAMLLGRGIFVVLLVFNTAWAVWIIGHIGRLSRLRVLRTGLMSALFVALLAEVLGYRNLSIAVLRALAGTILATGFLALTGKLFTELFDRLNAGRYPWHQRLRQTLELGQNQPIPGLLWLQFVIFTLLWTVFLYALMRIWGLSDAVVLEVRGYLIDGFTVGSLRVFPVRILLALITFVVLFALSGWMRAHLKRRWLGRIHMEPGAREAMVTIVGYAGTATAIIAALSVAGLELGNLAIIAGALSVGIGFGLQNIVNNFVSGLILLFERPIKTGDWIVVGGTEGYVRRIRIRSTQIQTFDRADVIVPNSELISGQVTNWMLYDPRGRIRVPVGVAYGSDTGVVKELLLKIAAEHPLVINDDAERSAKVFFRSFGDSSLNFELHCHIGHIDQRMQVISDLNFAIDAEFRNHAIEMPFPQRDIHLRDWPAGFVPPSSPRNGNCD